MSRKAFIGILVSIICAIVIVVAALVIELSGKTPAPADPVDSEVHTFLSGTTVNGLDVSGLSTEDAASALTARTEGYTFTLTLGESSYTVTGEELSLAYNQDTDLQALLEAQQGDSTRLAFTVDNLYTADVSALRALVEADYAPETQSGGTEEGGEATVPPEADSAAPKNAYLRYDEAASVFIIVPDEPGTVVDCGAVAEQSLAAILALEAGLTMDMDQFIQQAEITADDEELLAALDEANSYLDLDLTYTFTPKNGSTSTVTVSRAALGSIYYLDDADGMSIKVDEEILGSYVSSLADKYSVAGTTSKFKTTGGSTININVSVAGQSVDTTKLYNDMLECLTSKTGGKRTAPYVTSSDSESGYWGGNYVEIDLTSQHLWVYKNGKCVVSCDVVSGNVANNTTTPTGCFTIFAKNTDRYLNGSNIDGTKYSTWVNYFMPFSGGCGIHDATWRTVFGGTEYYYNGSHGCVGVTLSNAKTIYNNVSVGTHVVIYGGISASSLPTKETTITFSQSEYTIEVGQTIDLGITTNSDGKQWLSVSKAGVVTVLSSSTIRGESVGDVTVGCYLDATSTYKSNHKDVVVHVVPAGSMTKDQEISVSVGTNSLIVGEETQIQVTGNQSTPTYSTSNSGVATVDSSGKIKAVGAGDAVITITCPATTGYNAASKTVTVHVSNPALIAQSITATAGTTELQIPGGTTQITVTGNKTSLTYASSNESVAVVDSTGKVTAVGVGETVITITAVSENGYASVTAQLTIRVTAAPPPVDPGPGSGSGSGSGSGEGSGENSGESSGENP